MLQTAVFSVAEFWILSHPRRGCIYSVTPRPFLTCSLQGALSPQGRVLCKILMEEMHTNSTPVYGNGFRAAYRTWTGMRWQGLRHMVEYVRQHGGFPG